jgi:TM2 domain-containing membrane protein YozV
MGTPNQPPGNPDEPPPWHQPQGYGPPQYPQVPPPGGYPGQPPGYPPQPAGYPGQPGYPGYGVDPQAPFGRDPATGLPLSDKSATTAGLLQLFFGTFGVGRFYIDSTQIAVAQLCLGLAGVVFTMFCLIGFPLLIGASIWGLVDAIMMFNRSVPDKYGRKLN